MVMRRTRATVTQRFAKPPDCDPLHVASGADPGVLVQRWAQAFGRVIPSFEKGDGSGKGRGNLRGRLW